MRRSTGTNRSVATSRAAPIVKKQIMAKPLPTRLQSWARPPSPVSGTTGGFLSDADRSAQVPFAPRKAFSEVDMSLSTNSGADGIVPGRTSPTQVLDRLLQDLQK